jgi:uncharacterized protein (DUF2147 family)
MKMICLFLTCAFACCYAQDIKGFWKSIDEETRKPGCMVAIYEYQDQYYGRIIGTFDKTGKMTETIDAPEDRAPGIVGQPFYCGIDLIWNLNKRDDRFKGRIVDPKKGNVYRVELWVEDGKLIVRGKLLCFGRNQTWLPASSSDFPENFSKPDVRKFVPLIPQVD